MSDADDLVEKAQRQLEEHKEWLLLEIAKWLPSSPLDISTTAPLVTLVPEIKLRVARVAGTVVSVVYEYPDELYAFLRSEHAPEHLRATLAGGHVVDPNQPTFTARREAE